MIKDKNVPDVGLEDLPLDTRPKLFPCYEAIGWILSQTDASTLVLNDTEKKAFSSFSPAYIAKTCKLSTTQVFMVNKWIKDLNMHVFDYAEYSGDQEAILI